MCLTGLGPWRVPGRSGRLTAGLGVRAGPQELSFGLDRTVRPSLLPASLEWRLPRGTAQGPAARGCGEAGRQYVPVPWDVAPGSRQPEALAPTPLLDPMPTGLAPGGRARGGQGRGAWAGFTAPLCAQLAAGAPAVETAEALEAWPS